MPSVIALRALLGASLGLGALDLVWINAALAPRLDEHERPPAPQVAAAVVTPPPTVEDIAPIVEAQRPPSLPALNERVYFATGSAALDTKGCETLRPIVDGAGGRPIVVVGHADYRGGETVNDALSRARARAVATCLVGLGATSDAVDVEHRGEADATGTGELWRDRRVDVEVGGTP